MIELGILVMSKYHISSYKRMLDYQSRDHKTDPPLDLLDETLNRGSISV